MMLALYQPYSGATRCTCPWRCIDGLDSFCAGYCSDERIAQMHFLDPNRPNPGLPYFTISCASIELSVLMESETRLRVGCLLFRAASVLSGPQWLQLDCVLGYSQKSSSVLVFEGPP